MSFLAGKDKTRLMCMIVDMGACDNGFDFVCGLDADATVDEIWTAAPAKYRVWVMHMVLVDYVQSGKMVAMPDILQGFVTDGAWRAFVDGHAYYGRNATDAALDGLYSALFSGKLDVMPDFLREYWESKKVKNEKGC